MEGGKGGVPAHRDTLARSKCSFRAEPRLSVAPVRFRCEQARGGMCLVLERTFADTICAETANRHAATRSPRDVIYLAPDPGFESLSQWCCTLISVPSDRRHCGVQAPGGWPCQWPGRFGKSFECLTGSPSSFALVFFRWSKFKSKCMYVVETELSRLSRANGECVCL
jgi:hypothetical protein